MENQPDLTCNCGTKDRIVFACSGASDLGYITDQVARKLSRNKVCKMNCLAVAASGPKKISDFKKSNLLVLDGCNEDCGKKIMNTRGITDFKYLRLTDLGHEKGKTLINTFIINSIYSTAANL